MPHVFSQRTPLFFISAPPCSSFLFFVHHHFNILTLLHFESDHVCFLPAPPFSLSLRTPLFFNCSPCFTVHTPPNICWRHHHVYWPYSLCIFIVTFWACFIFYLLHPRLNLSTPVFTSYTSIIANPAPLPHLFHILLYTPFFFLYLAPLF